MQCIGSVRIITAIVRVVCFGGKAKLETTGQTNENAAGKFLVFLGFFSCLFCAINFIPIRYNTISGTTQSLYFRYNAIYCVLGTTQSFHFIIL
jgi:hypothetical protein